MTADRRVELRIKIKSLAAEAKLIREEEQRCTKHSQQALAAVGDKVAHATAMQWRAEHLAQRARLREHRVNDVRQETRLSLLAYALIRGRSYASQEKGNSRKLSDGEQQRLLRMVTKFGGKDTTVEAVASWMQTLPGPVVA